MVAYELVLCCSSCNDRFIDLLIGGIWPFGSSRGYSALFGTFISSVSSTHTAWALEVTLAIALAATNKRDNQPPVLLRSDLYCKGLFRFARCDRAWVPAPVPLGEPVCAHSMDDDLLGYEFCLPM